MVLQIPCEHRPLTVVLEHLRFAKQRFDSSADPMAKVAFMLLPIATLLAFIGSDNRHKKEDRARAKKWLKKLTSKFAVSADWGIVCQAFLRLFDKQIHDVAKTHGEIRAFKLTLKIWFLKGDIPQLWCYRQCCIATIAGHWRVCWERWRVTQFCYPVDGENIEKEMCFQLR